MTSLSLTQKWLKQNVGQYPDQDRVYLDVDTVLASYPTLRPKSDVYTYDDGRTQLLICVHGLLRITYRGSSYNIPVAIWVAREYPRQSPIAYVVPTAEMLVRADRYVEPSGRCQTEYIQAWGRKSEGCSLLGLVESLQQDFSQRPPLYAKPKDQPPPITNSPAGVSERLQSPALPPKPGASTLDSRPISAIQSPVSLASRPPPPLPQEQRREHPLQQQPQYSRPYAQQQQPIPYVAPSHNSYSPYPGQEQYPPAAASSPQGWLNTPAYSPPPTRPPPPPPPPSFQPTPAPISPPPAPAPQPIHDFLDSDDDEPFSAQSPAPPTAYVPPRPPNPEMLRLHSQVHEKIRTELASLSSALALDAERLRAQQSDLLAAEPAIRDEMGRLEAVRDICRNVAGRSRVVVDAAQRNVEELRRKGEPEVDELVCATTIVHNQLINLIAEDNAIEDTIYHLHRALSAGRIDLERFLRISRSLAEEQFMKRALIQKIWAGLPGSAM